MFEEPADIELDKHSADELGDRTPPGGRSATLVFIAGILVLALVGGYLFLWRARQEPTAPAAAKKPADTRAQQATEEQISLPPLDDTDPLVRQLVGRLSSNPTVAAWLTTDGLILNFVVVSSRIANGETPVAELKALGRVAPFRTKSARDLIYIDPSSYHRYDRYAEAVSALDARGTARLYTSLKPRVRDAYGRVGGVGGGDFDPVLERAIVELLKVPVVEGDVSLEPKGIGYAFSDPRLEGMSAAQKQLLRMGPQNVHAVQGKLREIASFLGIPESRLPAASAFR